MAQQPHLVHIYIGQEAMFQGGIQQNKLIHSIQFRPESFKEDLNQSKGILDKEQRAFFFKVKMWRINTKHNSGIN